MPPLAILVHASGMGRRHWARVAPLLEARGHRTLAPDLSGYGGVPFDDATFHPEHDVDRVVGLLAAQPGPVDLVGHSYGGFIALRAAARVPDRVRRLALLEPTVFDLLRRLGDAPGLAEMRALEAAHPGFIDDPAGGGEAWLEVFVDYWNGPGAWAAMAPGARAAQPAVGRKVFREVQAVWREPVPDATLAALPRPLLLAVAERTTVASRRMVDRLAELRPDAETVTVAGAGHMFPLTRPAETAAALLPFMSRRDL